MSEELANIYDVERTFCLDSLLQFTRYFFKKMYKRKFVVGRHHVMIADALNRVYSGELNRLIINIAPRFGKTELAVKNFIAMGLAINPAAKFIHLSYSDSLARSNSSGVLDIMNTEEYQRLFPSSTPISSKAQQWSTSAGGGLYAVSSAGQVTGFGAGLVDETEERSENELRDEVRMLDQTPSCPFGGAIIIDDPIKPDDARSSTLRDRVNNKFETTIRNRVNSRNTPIIIIMQRLDINDLCGYLERIEPDVWTVLKIPALQINDKGEEEALWPFKFTVEELHKLRETNSFVYETQYQQNPVPLKGLMYEQGFKTYEIIPFSKHKKVKAYVDTADTGADYLCCIVYVETEIGNYILDVLYTQKPMEVTEPQTAQMLTKYNVEVAQIESNNGGRGFARNVENQLRLMGNMDTRIKWFAQTANKQSRIFNQSASVQNLTHFPRGWDMLFPQFYMSITTYMKTGSNDHDDAPDALTGTIEMRPKINRKSAADYF